MNEFDSVDIQLRWIERRLSVHNADFFPSIGLFIFGLLFADWIVKWSNKEDATLNWASENGPWVCRHNAKVIPSGWMDYGRNPFHHPICLITFCSPFDCNTWPGKHKGPHTWDAHASGLHALQKEPRNSHSRMHEGSYLMVEREEGVKGWNCMLMASLSLLWELQLSGSAETNRGGSCGDSSIHTTVHNFLPAHNLTTTN